VKSNCVSVEPLETEFGRKRQINQSACNKDFSCIKGFCPSFVTVSGAKIRKTRGGGADALLEAAAKLPTPVVASSESAYNILVTGIGGTGVVTIGALLGMAAHIEQKGVTVLDFTGIAQKNGQVLSHVRIGETPDDLHAVRIPASSANLLLGCDVVASASDDSIRKLDRGQTHAIVNGQMQPTADFTLDPDIHYDQAQMQAQLADAVGGNLLEMVDATRIATALLGDAIASNLFMLGYAAQRGLLPISLTALDKAIELNGVAVAMNRQALSFGRLAAHDLKMVTDAALPQVDEVASDESLEALIARRQDFLTDYQDAAYADRYVRFANQAAAQEQAKTPGRQDIAEAVARNLFKLMAYKDEYEVARLYTDGSFEAKLRAQFEGDLTISYHLAPPLIADRDSQGHGIKREFGPWMLHGFKLLAKFKGLRGGFFDIFGGTAERKMERQLIEDYRQVMEEVLTGLNNDNHGIAITLATLPEKIRGYGHIKEENVKIAKMEEAELLARYREPETRPAAAE
jgi:indolepyruvate ferredoxin oxidoreductase